MWQREPEKLEDRRRRQGPFDDHAGEIEELPHQDDEGVEAKPQQRGAHHLFEDVAGKNLHVVVILSVAKDLRRVH